MYYGLEQDISFGASDPDNRAPLWQFGGLRTDTESYKRINRLNLIRKKLGELGGFHEVVGEVVGETDEDIAFERNGALLVLTKVCQPRLLVMKETRWTDFISEEQVNVGIGQSAKLGSRRTPSLSSECSQALDIVI